MTTATIKSDSQIKSDVLDELKWDTTVDETEVGVQVREGIVTLTGDISSYPKKLAARSAAHRVHGVLDVVDSMVVRVSSVWARTDEDLAKSVREAMRWNVLVPDDRVSTTVSHGVVTLAGSVDTWGQRWDAELAVQRLAGVKDVINKITVASRPVNPALLKREIEQALERQADREAKRLGVSVLDGVVTLTGTLRSWGEKNAIERVVVHAPGVRRVEDKTVVDPYQ